MTAFQYWFIIIQAVLVVATIAIALLAIYGEVIRRWLFRPQLVLSVGKQPPYTALTKKEKRTESDKPGDCQEINLRIINEGKTSANQCMIIIEEIYKQRLQSSGFFKFSSFIPRQFLWDDEKEYRNLRPEIPSFLTMAQIEEKVVHLESPVGDEEPQKESEYSLFVCVKDPKQKGTSIDVGRGTVVIPILICAENIRMPIKRYVEICWNGKNAADIQAAVFDIKMHNTFPGLSEQGG